MFGIDTPGRYFNKVRQNCDRLRGDTADPALALDAALALHHLPEWVWVRWLKNDVKAKQTLGIRRLNDFWALTFRECPSAELVQELANGVKHCVLIHSTKKVAGYGMGPFGIGPFGKPYLLVDNGEEVVDIHERYKVASTEIFTVESYWVDFFGRWELFEG